MFEKKINKDYLNLCHIIYGGDFFLELENYRLKEVDFQNSNFIKCTDEILSQRGNNNFYCYKSTKSGFSACLFESTKSNELVVVYRGTERFGLGENEKDFPSMMKDVVTDLSLFTGSYDEQFNDAWKFFKAVKAQNPKRKIIIAGQSLGGAIAQIVAAKEYTVNRKKFETHTYNAPGCRHLLDVYDCNTEYNYSFIRNYAVVNDWCGMYGEHVGETYLISQIPLKTLDTDDSTEVINNVLFTTHEGIFKYSKDTMGKIFKRPKNLTQNEALSLWYFDKNNPLKDYPNLSAFIKDKFPMIHLPSFEIQQNTFIQKTEQFLKDNIPEEIQNSGIAVAIKNAADDFMQKQAENINKFINNSSLVIAMKTLDSVFSSLTTEQCERAKAILKHYE